MAKWVCKVCGYVHEGDTPPEVCPICKVSADKFEKVEEEKNSKYAGTKTEAREEGFEELAIKFENVGKVERSHEARYLKLLDSYKNGKTFKGDAPKGWKCRQCGFIYEGEEAPERCPTCGYPKAFFERMTENY